MNRKQEFQNLVTAFRNEPSKLQKALLLQELYQFIDDFSAEEKNEIFPEQSAIALNEKEKALQQRIKAAGLPTFEDFLTQNPVHQ